jgi:hypothetical protein
MVAFEMPDEYPENQQQVQNVVIVVAQNIDPILSSQTHRITAMQMRGVICFTQTGGLTSCKRQPGGPSGDDPGSKKPWICRCFATVFRDIRIKFKI